MCAILVAVLFITIGSALLSASASMLVVGVRYLGGDVQKEFSVTSQIDGDVLVYYELPGMLANRKYLIENKDPDIINTMMSRVKCLDAETQASLWRRTCDVSKRASHNGPLECAQDERFAALINGLGSTEVFKPCGLLALSAFLDEYRFEKLENSTWTLIPVSEEDIALPSEAGINSKAYGSKIVLDSGDLYIKGEKSWLRPGAMFEHFKVWYRPPASPHVRNLWGRIKGPLKTGRYRVQFTSNSPLFTQQWGLKEKGIILTEESMLGSKGACETLGGVFMALGVLELFAAAGFGAAKLRVKISPF